MTIEAVDTVVDAAQPRELRYPGITRLLCATAYLVPEFADWARSELVSDGFRANVPCPGIDLHAVAQHSFESRRRREVRDRWLQRALIAWPFLLGFVLWRVIGGGLSASTDVIVILFALLIVPVIAFALTAENFFAANKSAIAVAYPQTAEEGTDLAIVGIDPQARAGVPEVNAETVARLDELRDANVVVFAGDKPFVGAGTMYDSWTLTIDTRWAPKDQPDSGPPQTFIPLDLHDHLQAHVPIGTLPDLRYGRRLYVNGWGVADVPGLVDVENPSVVRPRSRLDDTVVDRFVSYPTESARVYSYFESYGWRGQLQPSVYVRVSQSGEMLFVEATTYLLFPLGRAFFDVHRITMHRGTEILEVLAASARRCMSMLFRAPHRNYTRSKNKRIGKRRNRDFMDDLLKHRRAVNQGATTSVRQMASFLDQDYHFALSDEAMQFQVLNMRILDVVRDFLVEHTIDTSSFDLQYLNVATGLTNGMRKLRKGPLNR